MIKIAVLDYGLGNVRSICNALEHVGARPILTRDTKEIRACAGLILPGVGAFAHGMKRLEALNLVPFLQDFARTEKPLLGICLGMQMLFTDSDEFGHSTGLNLLPGHITRLDSNTQQKIALPNIGWSQLKPVRHFNGTILEGVQGPNQFYFIHSFALIESNADYQLSYSEYQGVQFCSTVQSNQIIGCQYHPEKSGKHGLKIIGNFVNLCKRAQL